MGGGRRRESEPREKVRERGKRREMKEKRERGGPAEGLRERERMPKIQNKIMGLG